jgi:hypothetical protein
MSIIEKLPRDELEKLTKRMFYLLHESRNALPAILMPLAKLHNIDLSLANRIDDCLDLFKTTEENSNEI